jgi:cyclic pyranopterin phosphate synthase
MPAEGVPLSPKSHLLTFEEIERLAALFVSEGVTKIRLTGGEPLVRKEVEDIVTQLGKLQGLETLAMTTNGLQLAKKLPRLQAAGLNLLNISLDTLKPHKFQHITRRKGFESVMDSINLAIKLGYKPKINMVAMKGFNDDEVIDFVVLTKDKPIEVRFIEYMPFDGNKWLQAAMLPYQEMLAQIKDHFSIQKIEDDIHNTSRTYQVAGFEGKFGFITSMSAPFCEGCNRLRITADGHLKVCLFGNAEVSLRDAMRQGATDDMLRSLISDAVLKKKAAHAGMLNLVEMQNRPMILIGG